MSFQNSKVNVKQDQLWVTGYKRSQESPFMVYTTEYVGTSGEDIELYEVEEKITQAGFDIADVEKVFVRCDMEHWLEEIKRKRVQNAK